MNSTHVINIAGMAVQVTRKRMKSIRLKVTPLGEVHVSVPYGVSDEAEAERATKEEQAAWRKVVKACVPPLIKAWEPLLQVQVQQLTYRNMKSRWGSCQPSTGKICINTRLALYPPECLEYVVVHEMCHLLVANHGPEFKKLLTKIMPDWKSRANKLRA